MRASSWLRALPFGISRDGLNRLESRFLGSATSSSSSAGGDGDSKGTGSGGPSSSQPKRGSAADLLKFLEIHRKEWKHRPLHSRKIRSKTNNTTSSPPSPHQSSFPRDRQQQRQHQPHVSKAPYPYQQQNNHSHNPQWQRTQQQHHQQKISKNLPKSSTALGLSQSRRSREITNRVVAAYANADAQLRSQELSKEDKLNAAHRCILSFTRFSNFPLSDINISAMMHRVCRLVTHRGLGETKSGTTAGAAYPNLDHQALMERLLQDVVTRAKVQLLIEPPAPPPLSPPTSPTLATSISTETDREIDNIYSGDSSISTTAATTSRQRPEAVSSSSASYPVNNKVHDSTAALALYSCGTIGMHLSQEDLDALSGILLTYQPMWTEQRVVMVLLALARLGIDHGAIPSHSPTCALLDALYSTAEARISEFSAEELSTVVWAFASVEYNGINSDFLTKLMAEMLPKVDELPIVGVFSTLEGLMMHEWVPPAPKSAWMEVKNEALRHAELGWLENGGDGSSSSSSFDYLNNYNNTRQMNAAYSVFGEEGRFQVKDLRELQSLAKEWELQRRSGLAELLKQQEGGGSGGGGSGGGNIYSGSIQRPQQNSTNIRGDSLSRASSPLSLDALAQSAIKARADRANKAKLSDVAVKVARELRASVRSTAGGAGASSPQNDASTSIPFENEVLTISKHVSEDNYDEDALVERLLTGEWPSSMTFLDDSSSGGGGGSGSPESSGAGDMNSSKENNESEIKSEQGQQQKQQENNQNSSNNHTASVGKGRRRIYRLGPLLAEASINPSSGREIIQPHYERAHLWDPLLLHPSQQQSVEEMVHHLDVLDDFSILNSVENSENQISGELSSLGGGELNTSEEEKGEILPLHMLPDVASSTDDATSEAAAAAVEALARRVTSMIPDARPDQAVSFARYFSALRHYDRELLIAVREKVEHALENYYPSLRKEESFQKTDVDFDGNNTNFSFTPPSSQSVPPMASTGFADFLWSFASLGIRDLISQELARKAIHALLQHPDCSPGALSRAAWSLAVLGHLDALILKQICARIVETLNTTTNIPTANTTGEEFEAPAGKEKEESLNHVILKQLFQAALQVEISTGESHETLLPIELRTTAEAAWNDRRNFLNTSNLQRQVAGCLQNLGLQCVLEYAPEGSFIVIDIAVFTKNNTNSYNNYTSSSSDGTGVSKVAVEVDGPYHYATNEITHELGAMQLRDSLLRHSGWEVVSVPYYEWMHVKPWEREIYLEAKVMPVLQRQG